MAAAQEFAAVSTLQRDVGPIVDWITRAGLTGLDTGEILSGYCERLGEAGINVERASLGYSIVHPQVRAFLNVWRRGEGLVEQQGMLHSEVPGDGWFNSPFHYLITSGVPKLRCDLRTRMEPHFPVFDEFREAGFTDWVGYTLEFGWSQQSGDMLPNAGLVISCQTRDPDRFTDAQVAMIDATMPVLALAIKATETFRMSQTLLATYVGSDVAQKVLSGRVIRGTVETIRAVLFLSDLRGFTRRSSSGASQ